MKLFAEYMYEARIKMIEIIDKCVFVFSFHKVASAEFSMRNVDAFKICK